MSLNAYINDFPDTRNFKEKCFICKRSLNDNYFTLPTSEENSDHDDTRAYIKENRMCSKRCMNSITLRENDDDRRKYGKTTHEHSTSNM